MPDIAYENPAWGSHLPALLACLLDTTGPVLEVGIGFWSTPMLAAFCRAAGRNLVSVEANPEWCTQMTRQGFPVLHSQDYGLLPELAKRPWSVVLLDHSPGSRRFVDALLFRESAEYVVVHDAQADEIWVPFRDALAGPAPPWSISCMYTQFLPHTAILSQSRRPKL